MKRENLLRIVLNAIFLIVFNACFFVLGGTDHNASVWISYGFIHFAYFMLLLMPKLIPAGKSVAVFKASIFAISLAYFLTQLVTGVTFILIAPEGYKIAFVVQLCIAGLYGVVLVLHMIANEWTAGAEKKRQVQISYIKDASLTVKGLLDSINDKEAKKKVERVYDALYSSPVKSHPDLEDMEYRIQSSIRALGDAVASGNKDNIMAAAGSLEAAINERNKRLATYN